MVAFQSSRSPLFGKLFQAQPDSSSVSPDGSGFLPVVLHPQSGVSTGPGTLILTLLNKAYEPIPWTI